MLSIPSQRVWASASCYFKLTTRPPLSSSNSTCGWWKQKAKGSWREWGVKREERKAREGERIQGEDAECTNVCLRTQYAASSGKNTSKEHTRTHTGTHIYTDTSRRALVRTLLVLELKVSWCVLAFEGFKCPQSPVYSELTRSLRVRVNIYLE